MVKSVQREARCDRRHLAVAGADVAPTAQPLARIDDVPVGDDQLVLQRGIGGVEAARSRPGGRPADPGDAWAYAGPASAPPAAIVPDTRKSRRDRSMIVSSYCPGRTPRTVTRSRNAAISVFRKSTSAGNTPPAAA